MKRDMDLIRDFLMKIEEGQTVFDLLSDETAEILGITTDSGLSAKEAEHQAYNFQLMIDGGLVESECTSGGVFYVEKITWAGHDFLDSVRDPEVWAKTKKGAAAAGGFTVDLLKDLAKGLIKKQIEDYTGVKL